MMPKVNWVLIVCFNRNGLLGHWPVFGQECVIVIILSAAVCLLVILSTLFSFHLPFSIFPLPHLFSFFQIHFSLLYSLHFVQSVSSFQCCILWLADSCQWGRWRLAGSGHKILLFCFCIGCLCSSSPFHVTHINQSQSSMSPENCTAGVREGIVCSIEIH